MNIYIEGNIGSGKTTFIEYARKALKNENTCFITEPVEEWLSLKDNEGLSILENFYNDQKKWSFAFQMNSFISRTHKVSESNADVKFIERSVYTDRNCFANNCYKMGNMDKIEFDIYCKWHDWLCDNFDVKPSGFIYLKTNPEVSYERIKKRSRTGESDIPLEYLKLLHENHESWMKDETSKGVPVLYIDVTDDFYKDQSKLNTIITSIKEFISNVYTDQGSIDAPDGSERKRRMACFRK